MRTAAARLIRPALAGALTTVAGALVYLGAVAIGVATVGSGALHPIGAPRPPLAIAATVLVALVVPVVWSRARRLAGRLVRTRPATAREALVAAAAAGTRTDPFPEIARIIGTALDAEWVGVLVSDGASPSPVARWSQRSGAGDLPADLSRPLVDGARIDGARVDGARVVGRIDVHLGRAAGERERLLLADLADQATLVVRAAGRAAALRARRDLLAATAAELTASRNRLQDGAELARARLDRDLATGPGAQLATIRDVLARDAPAENGAGPGSAGRLVEAADRAIAELREIARGIYPPVLRDSGLAAAVAARYRRSPLHVRIDGAAGPLPADLELVAYLVLTDLLDAADPRTRGGGGPDGGGPEVVVRLERGDCGLLITVRPAALAHHLLVQDRVLAAGGGVRELPEGGVVVSLP